MRATIRPLALLLASVATVGGCVAPGADTLAEIQTLQAALQAKIVGLENQLSIRTGAVGGGGDSVALWLAIVGLVVGPLVGLMSWLRFKGEIEPVKHTVRKLNGGHD